MIFSDALMWAAHCFFSAHYRTPTPSADICADIKLSNFPSTVSCDSERRAVKGAHMIRLPARRNSRITRMEQRQLRRDVRVSTLRMLVQNSAGRAAHPHP